MIIKPFAHKPPEEAEFFGQIFRWQRCVNCNREAFTSAEPEGFRCGSPDCEETRLKTRLKQIKKASIVSRSNKKNIPENIRWQVWERDNFTCQHCGSRKNLTIDHVYPESKGGTLELSNLQTLCKKCNSRKGAR